MSVLIVSRERLRCKIGVVAVLMSLSLSCWAQASRNQVASARLGVGYAQMLNLAATPDLSAAQYVIENDASRPVIDVMRGAYESTWGSLADGTKIKGKVSGGYLTMKDRFLINTPTPGSGSVVSEWSGYSVAGGSFLKIPLAGGFTLLPALDVGVARLENNADYYASAVPLQALYDGLLFNWQTNAWLATPSLGLDWRSTEGAGKTTIRSHVSWSWISSFQESDPILKFNETAGVYSVRAEHVVNQGVTLLGQPLHWVLMGSYAGFFGPQHDFLGFGSVAELGVGAEMPLRYFGDSTRRLRASASYLFGSDVHGWSVSMGFQY